MNKLNKLSASHGAALFLFRSLFQLAKVIFTSKSLTKSSTKMLPFNYLSFNYLSELIDDGCRGCGLCSS